MAVTVVAQLSAQLLGVSGGDPADVENDTTAAPDGTLNVFVPPAAGSGGFLTLEPIAKAIIAACANGPCTVTISQGAGTLDVAVTQ